MARNQTGFYKNKRSYLKRVLYLGVILLIMFVSGCTGGKSEQKEVKKVKPNPAIAYWQSQNKQEVLLWEETDLNGDGEQDIVFIYQVDKGQCQMAVISKGKDGYSVSQSSRAPVENQMIKFQDIDEKLPVEITVSGSKKGNFGYAILRLENDVLIDLFAEGMNDCC